MYAGARLRAALVLAGGDTVLGEQITAFGVAGIFAVVAGVSSSPAAWAVSGGARPGKRAGVAWHALRLCGRLFIAENTVVDGYAVQVRVAVSDPARLLRQLRAALVLAATVLRDPATAALHWRKQWKYALVVRSSARSATCSCCSHEGAPLSHVAPAREVSMLFAARIGGHLLGERDRLARIAGAALIAFGVMALALG